jgi:hypothetical protein
MSLRSRTRRLLRLCMVGLLAVAALVFTWDLIQRALRTDTGYPHFNYASDEVTFMAAAVLVCVCGWLLESRLVRWLAPLPKPECPQCGYTFQHLASSRCPECGLELTRSTPEPPTGA